MGISTISIGKVKFNWRGNWAATTAYAKDDVVKYGPSVYTCVTAHTSQGTFAPDSAKWNVMVEGVTWEDTYNPATLYQKNDIVGYGGAIYVALQESTGETPSTASAYWDRLVGGVEFEGDYNNSSDYQKGDIVKYGGHTYIALQDSTGNLPTNATYWEILNKGLTYIGVYSGAITYKPGEMVLYGGGVFANKLTSIGNLPSNVTYWDQISKGFDYKQNYDTLVSYKVGDIVKYGARLYIAIQEGTGNLPTNISYWTLFADGFNWRNDWVDSTEYRIGDVVKYGARSYFCKLGHAGNGLGTLFPENTTYWDVLNTGLRWRGNWSSSSIEYLLDDVVEYSGSSYVCIDTHDSNGSLTPNTATTYWQALAVGDISSPMITTGDMIYRNASGAIVRLPIGPSGSFLVVNNGIPTWGVQAPEQNYYVALTGDDNNDGRTLATAWRTLQHACNETYNVGQCKISIMSGTYTELCPIKVGRSVVIEGDGLGAVTIGPENSADKGFGVGLSKDGSTPNANSEVFHVNNGSRIRNIVFRGFGSGAVCVSLDPGYGPNDTSVWITSQSPYVQNCTSFTDLGTGMIIDGALHNGGYKSIVANDWTQINSDGIGFIVKNDGRSELVSCFTYYCQIGYLCESGGKIRSVGGNNSYGEFGAVARGFSQTETPLIANLQLSDDTLNSVQTFTNNVHIFTSYRDFSGNLFCVGHTNPTGTDESSSWSNTSSNPFIAKFTSAGTLDWSYTYESRFGAVHSIVEIDSQYYAGGVVYDGGTNKGWLLKISASGEIAWQKTVGDTDEIVDLTTDGTNALYAVGNHITNGVTVIRVQPSGIISWSRTLDYNDSSINTLTASSICYAGSPTTSTDSYEAEGDATAEDDLYIALRDTTANVAMIARLNNSGGLVTSYNYGNLFINKLRLDTGSGDGIYMMAAGYYDPAGAATKTPFAMRVDILGNVEWQISYSGFTQNGEFKDVLPQGDDVYICGYFNDTDSTQTFNKGLLVRISSNGTTRWVREITDDGQNVVLNGVALDGVNVISAGAYLNNSVIFNIQRDLNFGLGTIFTRNWTIANPSLAESSATVATKGIQNIYSQSTGIALVNTNLTLDQSPGISRNVEATRSGFAGIGTGVTFSVNGLLREPKEGSVLQIYGDTETYFTLTVANYTAPTIAPGNYPSAKALLDANRAFIQSEVIAWINVQIAGNIFPFTSAFVYNQSLCSRDVGLIVDALSHDLDFNTNGESIEAAFQYYFNSSGLTAITTQKAETLAAIDRLKSVALDVIQKNTVTPSSGNTTPQVISGTTGEAGAITLLGDNIDTIYDIIDSEQPVSPDKIGYGSATIAIEPPIPSNKTPSDGIQITFREAFSQVRMTSHDFLDIGTGGFADTNYPVIIQADYAQQPNQDREVTEESGGRCFYVTTDQDGNFRVGNYFKVEQSTGRATLSSEEFDLSGLNELQLGSITAGRQGATVNEFSTDGTFADNSDTAVPTERATKTYVDNSIANALGAATTLKVGTSPNITQVEVTGSGSATDTIDFDVNGVEIAQIGAQYIKVPSGDTASRPGSPVNGYIRYNTETGAFEGYVSGQWSGIGGGNPWSIKTSPYTSVNNDRLFVDTTSGAVTITLPATPNIGDTVRIIDAAGTFHTNNLTVARNGSRIMGDLADLTVDTQNAAFSLVFCSSTYGWRLGEA
jgi:hypothetical protein